jgi:hypothetical protein
MWYLDMVDMFVVKGYWDVNIELLIGNGSGSCEVIIWYGRCGVLGQRIQRFECGIVNWKYVTVGFVSNAIVNWK